MSLHGKTGQRFCSYDCGALNKVKTTFARGCKTAGSLRRYLLATRPYQCVICTQSTWQGKPLTLEVDHISGHSDDNSEENLRLLCPNCHSQTPTYKAKNKGNGRKRAA